MVGWLCRNESPAIMALSHDIDARLLKLPCQTVCIGDCSFFTKVHFTDSSYCLLVSDLSGVWCEEAAASVILERSKELNKRLKAPISSFLGHLSQLILPLLDSKEKTPSPLSCTRTQGTLLVHVKSQLSGLPFYWDFHCREASVSTVRDGTITYKRLKTETFDENSFYKSFMSKNIPEQCGSSGLSERLQQLYSDVMSAREEAGAADAGNAPSHESNSRSFAVTDPSTTQQDMEDGQTHKPAQAPPDDVLSLTQRPTIVVSKAKKRKAKGLFT
ncbi:non-homologous end-joining factor 1 [Hyla sarda]|uniref:non-homologous end-joining factor 1 n=1 Tax=Hyla sarda TaxID=327740 RepID=UPI0024C3515D|nr:non-homologous end-joining factor 1 [Hyla sarda]